MALSIDEQIYCIGDTISSAQWHFDLWEAIEDSRSDPKNVEALNKYLEFFRAKGQSLFESYIISCYQLFETRRDTVSFIQLKRELMSTESFDVDIDPNAVASNQLLKPTWQKICKICNNSVGHMSKEKNIVEIFKGADLKPAEIRAYIEECKKLLNNITYRRNQSHDAFNIRGQDAFKNLLSDLRSLL